MAIDLITQYQSLVDEKFTTESKKSLVTNNDYSWTGAHSIKVYKVTTAGMNDYARNGGYNRYGQVQDLDATTQELTLKKDRSFTFAIDISVCQAVRTCLISWIVMRQGLYYRQAQHLSDRCGRLLFPRWTSIHMVLCVTMRALSRKR